MFDPFAIAYGNLDIEKQTNQAIDQMYEAKDPVNQRDKALAVIRLELENYQRVNRNQLTEDQNKLLSYVLFHLEKLSVKQIEATLEIFGITGE